MNLIAPKFFGKKPQHSGRRLVRTFAAILSVLISTAAPALADTVRINHVVQTLTNSQATDIRLSTLSSQDPVSPGTQGSTPKNESQASNQGTKTESIITGVTVASQGPQIGVDISEEGEVEGTICDCGEILIAGGAFPKWPFLFLGAIPVVFITECCDGEPPRQEEPPPTPTVSPTPTAEVPEPASLLLFGTGLVAIGAGLRRRLNRTERGSSGLVVEQDKVREEE